MSVTFSPPTLRSRSSFTIFLLVAFAFAGCFAERRGLSRDGLLKALEDTGDSGAVPPTIEELIALRAPPPGGTAPPVALATAPALERARDAAARGDIAKAEASWAELAKTRGASADAVDGLLHRCVVEAVLRRSDGVLAACPAFLDKAAGDPRALAALRVLVRARFSSRAASDMIAARGDTWVAACAKTRRDCADLAWLIADERLARVRIVKDAKERAAALASSGRATRVDVAGPFDGEFRTLFAADARREQLPWRAPAFEKRALVDDDGAIIPASSLRDGVHRLTFDVLAGAAGSASNPGGGPVDVTLYLTGARAARIRVDGVVVAERDFDAPSPAVIRSTLILSAGAHRVDALVLVGGRDTVSLALLDRAGRPLAHVAHVAHVDTTGAGSKGTARGTVTPRAPDGGVEALVPRAGNADVVTLESILLRQLVARAPSFGVHPDENQELARVLAREYGWSPLALAVAAEALGEDRALPERVSASLAGRLWAEVKRTWPNHPVALISAARELRDERPDAALAAYRTLVKAQPKYAFGHRELIDVALDAGLVDEALASANALLELDESRENIDAALSAFNAAGDAVAVARLQDKRAVLDDAAALPTPAQARRLLDAGHTAEGLDALTQAQAHAARSAADDPYARDEWLALLALLDTPRAQRAVEDALEDAPRDNALLLKRAQLAAAKAGGAATKEGREAALRALAPSLPLLRGDARVRAWLEELGLPPPWLSRFALGDEVIRKRFQELNTPGAAQPFPGHGSVALLDDVERIIEDDEGSLVVRHLIVELRSKEALDRFGEVSLGDERLLRLRVVKPTPVPAPADDGKSVAAVAVRPVVVEPERHRGIDDVSLPQLAPGDIVERLTVERDAPSRLGGNFETRTLDGTTTPALSRRYIVSWPEGWAETRNLTLLSFHDMGEPKQHHVVDSDGTKRLVNVFSLENVDAVSPEPYAPDRGETAKTGGYAWGVDDALWARLRGTAVAQAAQRDAWIDDSARRIAGSGDDEQKLRRIFQFVTRRIEPENSPDDATEVLASGKGRRTPLVVALLRGAGLDAAPVALHLRTQAPTSTLDGDSWSIGAVRVRLGQREHYALVDGNAVLDQLPPVARDAKVLDLTPSVVSAPGAKLVGELPDDVIDDTPVHVQVDLSLATAAPTVSAAGSGAAVVTGEAAQAVPMLSGVVVITVPPAKADGARRGARRATQDQLRAVLERSLADSLPGVRVVDVKAPNLDAFGAPLRLGARIEVPLPDLVDGTARFEHLFAEGASGGLALAAPFSQFLGVADRTLPVLVAAESEVLEVQISLPRNAAFVEAPRPVELVAGPFGFAQQVQITDGVLYWRREMTKQTSRISVEEWPAVRASLASIVAKADARLSFALGGSSTDNQKQARADQNR